MRALCFKVPGSEAYQCSDTTMAAPPWTTLRDFEYASFLVKHEEDDAEAGASYLEIKGWRLSPAYDINQIGRASCRETV